MSLAIVTALAASLATQASVPSVPWQREERFFQALAQVEAGPGTSDHHRAIGPYQIHRAYWLDACKAKPSLKRCRWFDCTDEKFARGVVATYLRRYCRDAWLAGDWTTCADVHHQGPRAAHSRKKSDYAQRVVNLMQTRIKK